MRTVAGGGSRGFLDGADHIAKFSWPYGIASSQNHRTLYVADSGNACLRSIDLDSGSCTSRLEPLGLRNTSSGAAAIAARCCHGGLRLPHRDVVLQQRNYDTSQRPWSKLHRLAGAENRVWARQRWELVGGAGRRRLVARSH